MTASQWRAEWSAFCPDGQRFAVQFDTPAAAFKASQHGGHMAYWLCIVLKKDELRRELRQMLSRDFGMFTGCGLKTRGEDATAEELSAYATRIRARFNSDGTRRKRATR